MSQIIKCPHCQKEFPMEEGLKSHLDELRNTTISKAQKDEEERIQKLENDKKLQEEKTKKLEEKIKNNDVEKESAIKIALEADRVSNKEHFDSLMETKIKKDREDQSNKFNEDRKVWELEKSRLNTQIQTLNQTVNQGATVDQGSGAEISLGEFLKKIFKDNNDKIQEYEKGEGGGDWIQEVTEQGIVINKILYERKKTKAWNNGWLGKLQEDMKDSNSNIGIIFTRTTPKDFPKDAQFIHKGNIFICKYDYDVLKTLAQTQRWLITQLNKERKSGNENQISALKFWENPKVKNATFKAIGDRSDTRKKLKSAKKNVEDAIEKIDSMGTNVDELFQEVEKIGLSTFLEKKKQTDQKK